MTLLKDLIDIPEKVQRGDFVLNLSNGLEGEAVQQTLSQYVVTPQLAKSFEDALSFIKSTVVGGQNRQKGAYLHGSFGSGKSHFMAVLHLLLQGNTQARAINELAPSVAKHDEWMQSHNILLVPYHMIGATSIEAGILGGYAAYIKKRHPEAPTPGFYQSDRLFEDAASLRQRLGDDAFFKALNEQSSGAGDDDGWGDLAAGWDAISFDAVLLGHSSAEDKDRLVGDLVSTFYSSVQEMANSQAGGYVHFDEGLRVMTQHAKALGYDGIVLFLDELILWLASHIADQQFITNNIQKVVKLVEPSEPRALPVASFIARQRDLREFISDQQYTGSDQEALSDSLKYWDGRFHTITLEDRNLPVIAEKRLLKPVNEAARAEIQQAFDSMDKGMREEVQDILLTSSGDRDMFRSLYPFSPALVQALVALSSALQRERTALKVMLMLLVDQRESLELGGVIPVGDLYDVIASEAEPFSETMRHHFDNAKQLFERKLLPLVESDHNLSYEAFAALPVSDPKRRAFQNDLRLLKTLLLSALVPEVESLKQLTGNKLAALNHGTIKSPIPGQEAKAVLAKCQKWAGQVGEIKLSEDQNPIVALQLSGVDTESILEQAKINDTDGARRKLIKEMVFDAFGIREENDLFLEHRVRWRGTLRSVEVTFQNIREITDLSLFEARGESWKVIIDFPFDSPGHGPADDRARVQDFLGRYSGTRTLCWLPNFFSQAAQKDLGVLVRLEYILKTDDRFSSYSKHLSPVDRNQAKTLLDNQRSQLRQRLKDCLFGAYGGREIVDGSLDATLAIDEQVMSLQTGFEPRLPHGATLGQAFEQLLDQAFRFQYPDHPEFDCDVKLTELGKLLPELRRAVHASNGRIDVDSPVRPLMRGIAQPLGLGEMHERHFIFKDDWPKAMARGLAQDDKQGESVTVERLRGTMDIPNPRGLPEEVQNLLIMVFAEHGQYAFMFHGNEYDVTLKDMPDNLVLIKQALAEPEVWKAGCDNAGAIFGLSPNPLRTANHQNTLVKDVHEEVRRSLPECELLVDTLKDVSSRLRLGNDIDRLKTAEYALVLLKKLYKTEGADLLELLAQAQPPTSLQAVGKSIRSARSVAQALRDNNWELLTTVWQQGGDGAKEIKQKVASTLSDDELVSDMAATLRKAQQDATRLISQQASSPTEDRTKPGVPGRRVVKSDNRSGLTRSQLQVVLRELEAELSDDVTVDISYVIRQPASEE